MAKKKEPAGAAGPPPPVDGGSTATKTKSPRKPSTKVPFRLRYSKPFTVPGEDGQPVTVRLVKPWLKGKIDRRKSRAAIRMIRDQRLKAEAEGHP